MKQSIGGVDIQSRYNRNASRTGGGETFSIVGKNAALEGYSVDVVLRFIALGPPQSLPTFADPVRPPESCPPDPLNLLTVELVSWADIIVVMEKQHRTKLQRRYRSALRGQRVICLDIPDNCTFVDPGLVELLKTRKAASPAIAKHSRLAIGRPY